MFVFMICVIILFPVVFIVLNFYTFTGLRVRHFLSLIPGYSELASWKISLQAAIIQSHGIKDYLTQIFGNYSSICAVWFLGRPNVYVSSPENIEVLLKSVQHITKGNEYFIFADWLKEGLLTSTGAKWHANRKMLTPAFHFRILESCVPILNSNADLLIKILKENSLNGKTINVESFISLCSLDIISETAMGVRLDAQLHKHSDYVHAVRRMGELCLHRVKTFYLIQDWIYNLTPAGREQKKLLNILHSFTESIIKESKRKRKIQQSKGNEDHTSAAFVDLLLEMAENEPGLFTDVEIRQEVDTFMFEGHETTSSSISWTLLLLGHNQDIQERAYEEIMSITGSEENPLKRQDLLELTYLEAIIKESLRLYPPVTYLSRKLDVDMDLEKYTVPAGTNTIVIPYFLHRRSDLYPDPDKFNPDRFVNMDNLNRHPFMYIPFSGGPRNCIGQKFAMMEMKVVICNILRHFRIQSVTQREGLKVLFSPILRPLNGTHIKLYPRV